MERLQLEYVAPKAQDEFEVDAVFDDLVGDLEKEYNKAILDGLESGLDYIDPEAEMDVGIDLQEEMRIAAPEKVSAPQLEWPESDEQGHISEGDYNLRLNYRLTNAGFLLDAARSRIDSEQDSEEWMSLKKVIFEAKSVTDIYSKVDVVIELESLAYDFCMRLGVTESDYNEARN